jgi:DNA processing protein
MSKAATAAPPTTSELPYWLAFNRIAGIGPRRYQAMLAHFGALSAAWNASPGDLRAAGLDTQAVRLLTRERGAIDPDAEMETLEKQGVHALT